MSLCNRRLIVSFRHRGLKRLLSVDERKIDASLRERIRDMLSLPDVWTSNAEPGSSAYHLSLKGDEQSSGARWSAAIWRLCSVDNHRDVVDVDLVDHDWTRSPQTVAYAFNTPTGLAESVRVSPSA